MCYVSNFVKSIRICEALGAAVVINFFGPKTSNSVVVMNESLCQDESPARISILARASWLVRLAQAPSRGPGEYYSLLLTSLS